MAKILDKPEKWKGVPNPVNKIEVFQNESGDKGLFVIKSGFEGKYIVLIEDPTQGLESVHFSTFFLTKEQIFNEFEIKISI